MGRNLMLGKHYKEMDSLSTTKVNALYYAAKDYLVKVDVNANSITAFSYEKTFNSEGTKKLVKYEQYIKTNNFFNSSESNWYETTADEFNLKYSKVLEMTEVLKHVDMKILRDTSNQDITKEDFLNG